VFVISVLCDMSKHTHTKKLSKTEHKVTANWWLCTRGRSRGCSAEKGCDYENTQIQNHIHAKYFSKKKATNKRQEFADISWDILYKDMWATIFSIQTFKLLKRCVKDNILYYDSGNKNNRKFEKLHNYNLHNLPSTFFFFVVLRPNAGHGPLILEVF